MGFEKVVAHGDAIKAVTHGPSGPSKGLAKGQEAHTPQKVKQASEIGLPGAGKGVRPQRG